MTRRSEHFRGHLFRKRFRDFFSSLLDTFGSKTKADEWLNRPNQVFSGRSPIQILTEDPGIVEEELVRIDHGMFV